MLLLFLESIGTTELLVILVVALVIFGPRKLPELGRSLGRSLNEFRRASEDFKRTWEREVEFERYQSEKRVELSPSPAEESVMRGAPQSPETISAPLSADTLQTPATQQAASETIAANEESLEPTIKHA